MLASFSGQAQISISKQTPIRFLALGDSYTIGQSVPANEKWPEQFRDSLQARAYSFDTLSVIAQTGWTTQNLLSMIDGKQLDQKNYNLVSLLIGVNNQYQGQPVSIYPAQFQRLLDSAIQYAGGNPDHVFVVSIPDYAYTPFGQNDPQISAEIDEFNHINDSISNANGVTYFNITPISRSGQSGLVASDNLHPSGYQYSLWVELMMNYVDSIYNGIDETATKEDPLKIYPVPSQGNITIEGLDSGELYFIELTDIRGKEVFRAKIGGAANYSLDLPETLKPGMYMMRVSSKNGLVSVKELVIE
jgi:lysophospholipase L1-like esterase